MTSEPATSRTLDRLLVPIAHGFGLGLLKPAPGTWGSLLGLPLSYGLSVLPRPAAIGIWAGLFLLGVAACNAAIRHFNRKDPGQCVVDEYVALSLTALLLPMGTTNLILSFLLFRLFDIWKPWPIKRFESLPRGWGIMADDVVAAGYASAVLWMLMKGIA